MRELSWSAGLGPVREKNGKKRKKNDPGLFLGGGAVWESGMKDRGGRRRLKVWREKRKSGVAVFGVFRVRFSCDVSKLPPCLKICPP